MRSSWRPRSEGAGGPPSHTANGRNSTNAYTGGGGLASGGYRCVASPLPAQLECPDPVFTPVGGNLPTAASSTSLGGHLPDAGTSATPEPLFTPFGVCAPCGGSSSGARPPITTPSGRNPLASFRAYMSVSPQAVDAARTSPPRPDSFSSLSPPEVAPPLLLFKLNPNVKLSVVGKV